MPDERSRMMVSQAMADKIGPEVAAAFMECVPPFAWTEIATKADLEHLEHGIRADLTATRFELLGAMEAQGSRTLRWTVGSMFAAVATLSAAMAGVAALAR